jgi:hypothetical protein
MTTSSSVSISDIDAITAALQTYLDAAKTGKSSEMRRAFWPQATIFGYVGDKLAFNGPIEPLFAWNDGNGPSENVAGRITGIEVIGQIAQARIEAENWAGSKFTDFMQLLKIDGSWKILNKVFHLH